MQIVLLNLYTDQRYELDEIVNRDLTWKRRAYTLSEKVPASERGVHFKIHLSATLNSTVDEFVPPYIVLDDLSFSSDQRQVKDYYITCSAHLIVEAISVCDRKNDEHVCKKSNKNHRISFSYRTFDQYSVLPLFRLCCACCQSKNFLNSVY